MAKITDIPHEIWHIISSFLPDGEVRALYSVNRALFELGMDEIYRSVGFASLRDKATRKCLDQLAQPRMAERIRCLSLKPADFGVILFGDATERQDVQELRTSTFRTRIVNRKKRAITQPVSPSLAKAQTLLEIIRTATKVANFKIQCHGRDYFPGFQLSTTFLTTGWTAFGSNLRALTLDIPVEAIQLALPPSLFLDNLEELTLDLAVAYRSTETTTQMCTSLLPFINRHSNTLKSFNVTTWDSINLSPLLQGMVLMPHLNKISFRPFFVGMTQTDTSGLGHLLSRHAENIEDLTIHFRKPMSTLMRFQQPVFVDHDVFARSPGAFMKYPEFDIWFAQPFFHVEFRRLRKLDLSMNNAPASYASGMIAYVLRSMRCLTHLVLHDLEFSFDQLTSFVIPLGEEGKIKYLMISALTFTPGLLDVLARGLPTLEELNLTAQRTSEILNNPNTGDFDITRELSDRCYVEWGLQRLGLKLIRAGFDGVKFREALVDCLPCVKSFNGLSPDDYIADFGHL